MNKKEGKKEIYLFIFYAVITEKVIIIQKSIKMSIIASNDINEVHNYKFGAGIEIL